MNAAALRVGLFAVLGLAALVVAAALAGGRFWVATDRAVMRFETSVYGLQTGAPVVYRGVKLGQVQRIGLGSPGAGQGAAAPAQAQAQALPAVPVEVEFERERLVELLNAVAGPAAAQGVPAGGAVPALVARGLVARLALQSLLTGQLYVDLDLAPAEAPAVMTAAPAPSATAPPAQRAATPGLPLVPTAPTKLQTLQAQLENLDLAQLGQDVAAVAAAARQLLAGPEPTRALARAADAAQALERVATTLQRDLPRLTRGAETTLAEGQRSLQQLGLAAQQVAAAASQVQALAGSGTPLIADVQRSAAELTRAARALREAADADSSLRVNAERALQDVSRAAQSLGELGETLERQPDVLWRGRIEAGGK